MACFHSFCLVLLLYCIVLYLITGAYMSEEAHRMVPFLLDRLRFRKGKLQVRRLGGGGRLIYREGRSVTGVYVMVTMLTYGDVMRVRVYEPAKCRMFEYDLTLRERVDLLGSSNPGNSLLWIKSLKKRMSFKALTAAGDKVAILNRTLYEETLKVSHRYLTAKVLCPRSRPEGGIDVLVYAPNSSEHWYILVSDFHIEELTGYKLPDIGDPQQRQNIFRSLLYTMR